jgi:formylmethanofuran dehydrogenase subunit E
MGSVVRLTLLFICLWLIIRFLRQLVQHPKTKERPRMISANVLPCAHCGTYIPESDAVLANGKAYCSKEHARTRR